MWSCTDTRRKLLEGEFPEVPEFGAHLEHCDACHELVSSPRLGEAFRQLYVDGRELHDAGEQVRGASEPGARAAEPGARAAEPGVRAAEPGALAAEPGAAVPSNLDGQFAKVWAEIERDRGFAARLRSLPSSTRWGILLGAAAVAAAYHATLSLRADFGDLPRATMVLELTVSAVVTAGVTRELAHPLCRPLSSWRTVLAAAGALLVPAAIALLGPSPGASPLGANAASGEHFWSQALRCFGYGTAIALLWGVVAWMIERGGVSPWRQSLLAAAAAGLVANWSLHLHCPITDSVHVWVAHVSVTWLLLPIFTAVLALGRPMFSRAH